MVYVKFCVASSLINESFRDSIPHESAPVDSFTVQPFLHKTLRVKHTQTTLLATSVSTGRI